MATVLLGNDVNKNIKTVVSPIRECFEFRKSTPKTWPRLKTARAGPHGSGGIAYDADNRWIGNTQQRSITVIDVVQMSRTTAMLLGRRAAFGQKKKKKKEENK